MVPANENQPTGSFPAHDEPAEVPPRVTPRIRLSVDLEGDVVNRLEEVRRKRNLSKSQAVRRALTLLALLDEDRYELILRDKAGHEPDRSIILVP